jgi:hypothetical protein
VELGSEAQKRLEVEEEADVWSPYISEWSERDVVGVFLDI